MDLGGIFGFVYILLPVLFVIIRVFLYNSRFSFTFKVSLTYICSAKVWHILLFLFGIYYRFLSHSVPIQNMLHILCTVLYLCSARFVSWVRFKCNTMGILKG